MVSATELFDLEEGEILVTEATSPNWTPAFAIIARLRLRRRRLADPRCNGQPRVRHPVRGRTSVATSRIKTGDLIEVDGAKGVVTIVERAATASA